jgi:hypothetical protein
MPVNMSKLVNPLTISIVGVVATVIAALLIYFLLIRSTTSDLAQQTTTYNANVGNEDPTVQKQAQDSVTKATQNVNTVKQQWTDMQDAKDPDIDYSDRMVAWNEYINELNYKLGPMIEQWIPTTGVKPTSAITTPTASSDPNDIISKNPIVIPLNAGSSISVVGSFPQVLHHIEAWNNFNRIVLIDKVALAGISPFVIGTYTATVYEFPRNADTPGPAVPSTAGAASSGGPPGGPPGMPPGGPPPQ